VKSRAFGWVALLIVGALLVVAGIRGTMESGRTATSIHIERYLMGTRWSIEVVVEQRHQQSALEAIGDSFDEVARIEEIMSEWRDDSPISRVNAAAGQGATPAPAELIAIVERALEMGRRSNGAFDVTWRGMGQLWRFDDEAVLPPSAEEVEAALARVDYRRVRLTADTIELPSEGMALGLGGIAKGYAIDRVATLLRGADIDNFYVDGGGDVLVSGRNGDRPWRVGVRDPRGQANELIAVVETESGAVVTSGDYERFRVVDGVRYHHIIDVRTGWPAQACQAVTVVAPSAESADALATAIFVLGPDEGLRLAVDAPDTEALIVDAAGSLVTTPGFGAVARVVDRSAR